MSYQQMDKMPLLSPILITYGGINNDRGFRGLERISRMEFIYCQF